MMERVTDGGRSVDYVLVYSLSRAFRNALDQEMTIQKLRRDKVEIVSQVEAFGADATDKILRQFVGIVNEYQSHEISRNTTRTMKENARRGYSNGGIIPFGYKSVNAEILGTKQKKRLAIEPVEAEVVPHLLSSCGRRRWNQPPAWNQKNRDVAQRTWLPLARW